MNKLRILMFLILLLPFADAKDWTISPVLNNKIFYCYNATDGVKVGTSATINCTNTVGFASTLATTLATNRAPGEFNISLTVIPGYHTCQIDCFTASAIDYTVDLTVDDKRTGLIANAINSSTDSDGSTNIILGQAIKGNTSLIIQATVGNQTAANTLWGQAMKGNITDVKGAIQNNASQINTNLGNGINLNTTVLKNDLGQGIKGNTTLSIQAMVGNQSQTNTLFATAITQNETAYWKPIAQAIAGNASNWFTSSFQTNVNAITGAVTGNASNWFTSVYQTRIDSAISTRSTVTASDVWNEQINLHLGEGTVGLNLSKKLESTPAGSCPSTNEISSAVDSVLNISHSTGNWSAIGTSGASCDLTTIAKETSLATISSKLNETSQGLKQNGTLILRGVTALDQNASFWDAWSAATRTLTASQSFSTSGSVGSVTGSVGSVTNPVTAGTVSDKTGYSLTTQDWTKTSDLIPVSTAVGQNSSLIRGAIQGNQTQTNNLFTGAFNGNESTYWKPILGAITGNASNWFTAAQMALIGKQSSLDNISNTVNATSTSVGNLPSAVTITRAVGQNLTADHSAGNWSATGTSSGSATITPADITNIATATANLTWYQNASKFCTTNSSFNRDMAGNYLCVQYKYR